MSTAIQHKDCGVYTFVSDSGHEQVVVNGLTGESVSITRTLSMAEGGYLYKVGFNESGWGCLDPGNGGPHVKLSSLGFVRKACKTGDGIIFIQNTATTTASWVDEGAPTDKSIISVDVFGHKMVATVFTLERMILASRIGVPRVFGGRVFWDVRSLKPHLKLKYSDEHGHHRFVRGNFDNVLAQWRKAFAMGGGQHECARVHVCALADVPCLSARLRDTPDKEGRNVLLA